MKLDNITLCAIDCRHPDMAVSAIEKSIKQVQFADCILFSDTKHPKCNTVLIDPIKHMDDYDRFVFKEMHKHINTDYVLIIQWDGWVIDKFAWDDRFLEYDYIGAPWSYYNDGNLVGNGGFSLRTKKLLQTLSNDEFVVVHNQAEDDAIGRGYRSRLESKHGIRFPPVPLAEKFSYESYITAQPTFGFHGIYNMWRHTNDDEFVEMFKVLNETANHRMIEQMFFGVMVTYFKMNKFVVLRELYKIMKANFDVNLIGDGVFQSTNNQQLTKQFIWTCEQL